MIWNNKKINIFLSRIYQNEIQLHDLSYKEENLSNPQNVNCKSKVLDNRKNLLLFEKNIYSKSRTCIKSHQNSTQPSKQVHEKELFTPKNLVYN